MQGDNYTGGFGTHILWRKQRVRGEGRERARGDGRQRGNLPFTTSKPPVAQEAGGIPNTNQTPRPKGWWDIYLFIYLLMNLYSIRFAIPHQPIRGKLPETLRGEDTKSLSIKYGRNFRTANQGFRLPRYGLDSDQNLDGFKCVPGVCRSDDLQGPENK